MVVGARQRVQFFRQKIWFLENNRALHKFLYGASHYLNQIIIKSVPEKTILYNHASHLNTTKVRILCAFNLHLAFRGSAIAMR